MPGPVLMIATLDVHDEDGMEEYKRLAAPTLAPHGCRILAVDDHAQTLEGRWPGKRTVVIEFPSEEAVRAWYGSPEYQAAADVRKKATTSAMAFVRALPAKKG